MDYYQVTAHLSTYSLSMESASRLSVETNQHNCLHLSPWNRADKMSLVQYIDPIWRQLICTRILYLFRHTQTHAAYLSRIFKCSRSWTGSLLIIMSKDLVQERWRLSTHGRSRLLEIVQSRYRGPLAFLHRHSCSFFLFRWTEKYISVKDYFNIFALMPN